MGFFPSTNDGDFWCSTDDVVDFLGVSHFQEDGVDRLRRMGSRRTHWNGDDHRSNVGDQNSFRHSYDLPFFEGHPL